jgi:hypothetical protein
MAHGDVGDITSLPTRGREKALISQCKESESSCSDLLRIRSEIDDPVPQDEASRGGLT